MTGPQKVMTGRVLHSGVADGQLLRLTDPLSFWGGFDPKTGEILDRAHPQCGLSITARILALPGTRGSAGTPAAVAEAIRLSVGPAAILLPEPDVNITIGTEVAARLYGTRVPVVVLQLDEYEQLMTGTTIRLSAERDPITINVSNGRQPPS